MISGISIVCMFITLFLVVGLPIGLTFYFYRRQKISIKAVMVGALMFFIFQMIIRIPIMTIIQRQSWYTVFAMQNTVLTVIIIGFTAGLAETFGRYLGLRFLLKNNLERKNGIAYGIGHGGIEAILLIGITYIVNIIYSILINTGSIDGSLVPQLLSTPPSLFLIAGVERVFAILFHIAAALLVTYGIMNDRKIYILYSLIFHSLLDSVVGVLQTSGSPIWISELWVAFIGILSLVFIIISKYMFLTKKI